MEASEIPRILSTVMLARVVFRGCTKRGLAVCDHLAYVVQANVHQSDVKTNFLNAKDFRLACYGLLGETNLDIPYFPSCLECIVNMDTYLCSPFES